MAIYGVLVGVNHYQNSQIRALNGCENDVNLFSQTLQRRFNASGDKLRLLVNEDATHQNIVTQFQEHLIKQTGKDDVAVFYFSGHGAQSAAPEIFWDIEPDRLDESLVCHDSRTPGIPDLLDKELRFLIAQLSQQCGHVAVFLDCCHGGHGTRFIDENLDQVRLAPADDTQYPLGSFVFAQQAQQAIANGSPETMLPASGKHILMSGSRDFQLSREKPQGDAFIPHGLFTYALCETLSSLQYPISYQELCNRVHIRVQSQNASQSPQIEAIGGADARQAVLGGGIRPLPLQAAQQEGQWKLKAGVMHGISQGDEVALFAGETSPDITQAPKAHVRQPGAFESTLDIGADTVLDSKAIYNAVVTRCHLPKTGVRLVGDENALAPVKQWLATDAGAADPGHFLVPDEINPRYELHSGKGGYYVTQAGDTRPLFEDTPDAHKALEQLAIMARWWQKLALENPQTALPADAVDIVVTYNGKEYLSEDVTLRYELQDNADGSWKQPAFYLGLRLKENFPKPLYCALLYFDGSTGAIEGGSLVATTLLANRQGVGEGQMNPVPSVKAYEGNLIPLQIKDGLYRQGITNVQDRLKLIVSEDEFDASILEQDGNTLYSGGRAIRGGIGSTLQQFMADAHNRSLDLQSQATKAVDWYAKEITLTIIRPQGIQEVRPDQAITLMADGSVTVSVEPHASFRGTVRLTNANDENSRSAGTQGRPPEMAFFADPATAFNFGMGVNADLGLDALEVFIGDGSRSGADTAAQVSAENPLVLSLNRPLGAGEQIIPYTYDGEMFLPLGYAKQRADGCTHIHIEDLPASAATTSAATKSLGSALKIFFRKLVYRDLLRIDEEIHVLGIPEFAGVDPLEVSGYVTDPAVISARVAAATRILLVIHGIIGDTRRMAGSANLACGGQTPLAGHYDLILAFDYENLNTLIQDTAKSLKEHFTKAGITAESGKQVDILAHSMGGLVARWFIEREGGGQLVSRLLMVGSPNGGSPIASLKALGYPLIKTWAYSNLAVILNGLTTAYVGGAAVAALVKLLDAADNTLDQMAPDSDFIHELANSSAPQTRYAVIAGETTGLMIPPDKYTERLSKLLRYLGQRLKLAAYDVLTAKLFKEANDMAVGHSSMGQFGPSWQASVTVETVECDHLSYFGDKATVQRIAQQLRESPLP